MRGDAGGAEELSEVVTMGLEPLFTAQISLLKEAAIEQFKKAMLKEGDPSDAMNSAEAAFVRDASASVPSKTSWSIKAERVSLVSLMQAIVAPSKKMTPHRKRKR